MPAKELAAAMVFDYHPEVVIAATTIVLVCALA